MPMGSFPGDPGWKNEEEIFQKKSANELIREALEIQKRFDINEQLNMMELKIRNAEEAVESLQYEFKKLKEML